MKLSLLSLLITLLLMNPTTKRITKDNGSKLIYATFNKEKLKLNVIYNKPRKEILVVNWRTLNITSDLSDEELEAIRRYIFKIH